MLQVFCQIPTEDEYVIHIYHHKIIGEGPQYIIHQYYESCWSICQTKGHDYPFKNTFFGIEISLPYIILFHWDLVVARLQVNLTEKIGSLELVMKVINLGNWVRVPDCDFV
jgi:hypothetical protein